MLMQHLTGAAAVAGSLMRLALWLFALMVFGRMLATQAVEGYWGVAIAGAGADAVTAVLAAAAYGMLQVMGRTSAQALLAAIIALAAASVGVIVANSRVPGEVFSSGPQGWIVLAAGLAAWAIWSKLDGYRPQPRQAYSSAVPAAAAMAIVIVFAAALSKPADWRSASLLVVLYEDAFEEQEAADASSLPDPSSLYIRAAGELPQPEAGGSSMLLIVVDGLTAADAARMPQLSSFAAGGLSAATLMVQATSREDALYAVLCGDYPVDRYSLLKPYAYAGLPASERAPCMPAALRAGGWNTAAVHAGVSDDIMRDLLLPAAGFAHTASAADNRSALAAAHEQIDALARQDAPWLLAVHLAGLLEPAASASELDGLLAGLIDTASRTGDRSVRTAIVSGAAPSRSVPDLAGFAAVAVPGGSRPVAEGLRGQFDMALTLLDAAGLARGTSGLLGRSLLALHDEGRSVWAGPH